MAYLLLYAELDETVGIVASLDFNAEFEGFSEFLGGDSRGKLDFFSTIWGFCTLRSYNKKSISSVNYALIKRNHHPHVL